MDAHRCQVAQLLFDDARRTDCPGWMALWMVAIACHESGWGRHVPGGSGADGSNNWIGYHWVDGLGWAYYEATEGGTGRRQRYRKFRDREEMFEKLLWLIERSRYYAEPRAQAAEQFAHAGDNHETKAAIRRVWMRDVSGVYCPADPGHGGSVLRIYRDILREMEA